MKFLSRFLIVFVAAVIFWFGLYFGVQSMPDDLPGLSQGDERPAEQFTPPQPQPQINQPERGGRDDSISLSRLIRSVAKNFILIALISGLTILGVRVLNRKPLIASQKVKR